MGFWDKEQCEYCNGPIVEKIMDLPRKAGEGYILRGSCKSIKMGDYCRIEGDIVV